MTDKERWARIKELQFAASELTGAERERFLQANCTSPEERSEVEERLITDAPTEFMKMPALGERPTNPGFRVGDRLGKYEIQSALGQGGGGAVYRAFDSSLKRQVAIKVLSPEVSADAIGQERFAREAEAASALNHPNIVTVYEIGHEGGTHFIAMEYIAGKSLREHIRKEGMKLGQFFPWAMQIADGLAAAHSAGMVHRDIKPGNVMITERGIAKIVDFGLAKAVRTEEDQKLWETITRQGTVTGTCAYMAPEQAEAKAVDARSDIFSFGCVLYEMVSGQRPFAGESNLSIIGRVLHHEPTPVGQLVPQCRPGLDQLIANCLRKSPAERWQSAADIRLVLGQLQRDWEAGPGEVERRPGWLWPAAAALAAGCLVTAGAFLWLRPAAESKGVARITALTMDGGLTTSPSLSADGKLLAYASDRAGEGNLDIWVQQVGGHAPIRLTKDPADEKDPDISADGTQVVFRSEREGGGIYVVPALGGGEPVLLAQGGRNPRLSPDGKSVAYWTGKEGARLPAGSAQAWIIPAGGGSPKPLGGDLAAAMYPIWSSDGSRLLVVGRKNPSPSAERWPDWWLVPPTSGAAVSSGLLQRLYTEPRTLLLPVWQNTFIPLAWDKHGSVIFSAQHADVVNLWSIGIDPLTGRTSGKPTRITEGAGSETQAALAPAVPTEAMAFSTMTLQFDVWGFPLDIERGARQGETRRITDDLASEFYPSLSWDAGRLAYSTKRGGVYFLTVRDLRTGKESGLLTSAKFLYPRLSGDGQWLAFGESPGNISRIASRGGAVDRLCERCGTPKSVSFDGSRILLEPIESPEDVRQLDVASKQISTLVPAHGSLFSGEMSRDGKWVVFISSAARPNSRLFVARVEGGKTAPPDEWVSITDADASYRGPHWSPGGNVVYFLSDRDGFRCLWARRVDPAAKTPVGPLIAVEHFHHARRSLQHVTSFDDSTLAIGGDMAVVVLGELTGNLWMREQKPQ